MSNNNTGIQAFDDSTNNLFQFNYWNDLTNPDIDGNLIVDLPYVIDGSANNQDNYPLSIFFLGPIITLISPTNNTFQLAGTVIIINVTDSIVLGQMKYNWDGCGNSTVLLSNSSFVFNAFLPSSGIPHTLIVYAMDSFGNWHSRQFYFITEYTETTTTIIINNTITTTSTLETKTETQTTGGFGLLILLGGFIGVLLLRKKKS
ncbi:MAG: hypothetical protein HeimC3_32160 [Candidatus Heimdallarchaeota archaeon LC_3]|nr:MAG: hypothetical protein HeimC3_32160 [Candidatus Heimdallarchaeota archaeon LC_3]